MTAPQESAAEHIRNALQLIEVDAEAYKLDAIARLRAALAALDGEARERENRAAREADLRRIYTTSNARIDFPLPSVTSEATPEVSV